MFSAASAASSGSISTSVTVDLRDAHGQRQPGGADAGAEIDHPVARLRAGRRRQQDRVMADAMAALRLAQPQPAAEHRVVGDVVRLGPARHRGRSS